MWGVGWLPTGDLRVGDWLRSHDGRWLQVEDVCDAGEVETVYNLCVAEYHTYFVGSPGWGFSVWAHNAEYPESDTGGNASQGNGGTQKPKVREPGDAGPSANKPNGSTSNPKSDANQAGGGGALSVDPKPKTHHIVSRYGNQNRGWKKNWTELSKEILKQAGVGIESGKNKVGLLDHQGPHPELYHQRVYERLAEVARGKSGAKLTSAVQNELDNIASDLQADNSRLSGEGL